jgi:hypothetical protein
VPPPPPTIISSIVSVSPPLAPLPVFGITCLAIDLFEETIKAPTANPIIIGNIYIF